MAAMDGLRESVARAAKDQNDRANLLVETYLLKPRLIHLFQKLPPRRQHIQLFIKQLLCRQCNPPHPVPS
jgi:hypothetical protein